LIQENLILHLIEKGKPAVRRGRKAASLMHRYKIVGLPMGIKPSLDGDGFFHPYARTDPFARDQTAAAIGIDGICGEDQQKSNAQRRYGTMVKKHSCLLIILIAFLAFAASGCDVAGVDETKVKDEDSGSIAGYITYVSKAGGLEAASAGNCMEVRILPEKPAVKTLSSQPSPEEVSVLVLGTSVTASTDKNGYFRIDGLEPGTYDVAFSHPNFKGFKVSVTVIAGETTEISGANFPLLYYLMVGLDEYSRSVFNLPGSVNSLEYFYEHVVNNNLLSGKTIILTNEEATKGNIEQALADIGDRMEERDYLTFYYHGHGISNSKGQNLSTHILEMEELISPEELGSWLEDYIPTNNITLLLEACYSGGFISSLEMNEASIEMNSLYGAASSLSDHGYTVITAAGKDQVGYQVNFAGGWKGLLTRFLVQGLKAEGGFPSDKNGSGEITAEELFQYAEPRIIQYQEERENIFSKGVSHPQFLNGHSDTVIFRYNN